MPPGLDAFRAMALGTAGFTAALSIHRMERNGQAPSRGPIVVTGATGGVGSLAIDMLSARGYEIIAVTGKAESVDYLKSLGASQVVLRARLRTRQPARSSPRDTPAPSTAWAARCWRASPGRWISGEISPASGLAGGAELKTTVMPFILRGVNLLGINSSATPRAERLEVWQRIATDLAPRHLARIAQRTIAFAELPGAFQAYLDGKVTGRTVVKIGSRP